MSKSIPDHSPLIASDLICHGCGEVLKPTIVRNNKGVVQKLVYKCVNPSYGCSYTFESNAYAQVEMRPLRSDGTEAKL